MPFAVTLRLDEAAAQQIDALWSLLAEEGISSSMCRLGYAPHVTLSVCEDTVPATNIMEVMRRLAADWKQLPITCPGLGVFPGPPATLFVTAIPTEALLARHAELHGAIADHVETPHYRPGGWIPHITLADDLAPNRLAMAVTAIVKAFTGMTAMLDQVDLVRFRPVKILWQTALQSSDTTL